MLSKLKASGQSILIVDKNLKVLARLANRHTCWSAAACAGVAALGADLDTVHRFVGV